MVCLVDVMKDFRHKELLRGLSALKIIIDPFYFEIFYVSPFSGLFGLIQHFSILAKEVFLLCPPEKN